eukprot:407001_1
MKEKACVNHDDNINVNDENKSTQSLLFVKPNISDFKFFISIDFGTDGLGMAYADQKDFYIHQKWNSKRFGATVKRKLIVLLNEKGALASFGMDAKITYMSLNSSLKSKWMLFDRFKMSLYEHHDPNCESKTDIADLL